ncbi:ABC transporter permease subunit [Natrarchaeobius oligotrophus]|uniref:ABC transporter permease n=1 Tax=Natrarchaeobius chitinivorans TaxID=1679083 RepID=A0A3N6MGB4_NATCH|nr:ABC transporter permease subunit [Natrarchaeobius chitinivorans]RQH03029.1 ABC transporter permease [Natrarchaeobius chitinivorans]
MIGTNDTSKTAILRLESRKLVRSSLVLTGAFALLSAFYYSIFPGFAEDAEELVEAFPEYMFEFFGLDELHTIEGFIAAEIYAFFWVVLLGVYFAYLGAGTIAKDVRERRMDLTLSNPISRESVLLQKVAALWVPLVVLNVAIPVIVFVGSVAIDETMNPVAITMVHVLSIPYLLVCAGIGLLCSVLLDRARTARLLALGAVIFLWLVDSFSRLDEDVEWIGALTPSRYFDETAILVHEEYAFLDAGVLLAAFIALVAVATVVFVRRDI